MTRPTFRRSCTPVPLGTTVRGLFNHACTGSGASGPFWAMPTTTRGSQGASTSACAAGTGGAPVGRGSRLAAKAANVSSQGTYVSPSARA